MEVAFFGKRGSTLIYWPPRHANKPHLEFPQVSMDDLSPELAAKRDRLLATLHGYGRFAVAFSGGIDSTVVAKAAGYAPAY